ncbi:Hint domain-containing protein [Fertoebacter nigrum]|uniref:Hint domain-containing protein n=1 Tax=Fertoeibacter niger TaxID=2656921 RepID=A0A8X8H722_9RHOB|nr:Hint domain-containing protein [Fertoeibacter niger]NUB44461.1 Hint domain-containing protein [Fertoeibacter niger]
MPNSWNAIYLGVQPLIDPDEGNSLAENARALTEQTYGSASDPLLNHIVFVTTTNVGGAAGTLDQNNQRSSGGANDQITYDLGSGPVTRTFDATTSYNATLNYADGTSYTGVFVIAQDTLGNTFLVPQISADANQAALTARPIESIRLNSVNTSNALGLNQNRQTTNFVTCFAAGTRIGTPQGEVAIEDLRAGDMVLTADGGPRVIRWAGARRVEARGALAPIRIAAGTLGNRRDLLVSPQHRLLLSGWRAELLFGADEVLVAACHLVDDRRIRPAPQDHITYHHLLFDRHEIIFAEGCAAESFFPGAVSLTHSDAATQAEILALFPELAEAPARFGPTARRVLRRAEARAWHGYRPGA